MTFHDGARAMQPKDTTTNEAYKGFTNSDCPFYPCHPGVKREFNCLFCYCPLSALECPGNYQVFVSANGVTRKDCSACTLPHDGYRQSWNFIQKWLERPVHWRGLPQTRRYPQQPEDALPDETTGA
ncbi:cysteine-rich small domain-containing protein [Rubrivivax sp. JA1024]|nr:cysteine-rich small domain-containing protein [Rubrivivax sp. JA1024]